MAPPPLYPTPSEQLLLLAAEAKRAGVEFECFWEHAVRPNGPIFIATRTDVPEGVVRWPTDAYGRRSARDAILGTKDGWRRAYEDAEPLSCELALARVGGLLADSDGEPLLVAA